jgi:hypothetical protein
MRTRKMRMSRARPTPSFRASRNSRLSGVSDLDPESMRGPTRAKVFLPLKLAEGLHVMQPTDLREISRAASDQPVYSSISVRVKNPSQVQTVEDAIKKMGFGTFSILDASRGWQFFRVLYAFLGIFGSLALIVASIGIVNTLVMAILERRREIGIMKAIGASDGDVKKLFFAEAGAMGILGGLVGVALGWAIGQLINFRHQHLSQEPVGSSRTFLGGPVVAGCPGDWILVPRQPGFRLISGGTRRPARSCAGAALRVN